MTPSSHHAPSLSTTASHSAPMHSSHTTGVRAAMPWEPLAWLLIAPLLVLHEYTAAAAGMAALARLVSLGPEGWTLLYFAGQPLVHAILLKLEVDLPVLAVTAIATNVLAGGCWLLRRKTMSELVTLAAFLGVFAAAVVAMVWTSNELTEPLRQRIQLFLAQGLGGVLVLTLFLRERPRLPQFTIGSAIILAGVAAGMVLCGAGLFSRLHDTPLIDWGRTSAIAALVFTLAAAFSRGWPATTLLALAGLAGLLSVSQLLRQSAYAAILSLAVCAVVFRHAHRFRLSRLLIGLSAVALLAALLQGDMLEAKLGRFLGRGEGAAVSNAARDHVALLAKDMIREEPLVGAGYGGFSRELGYDYYPHNMLLEILCEFGLAGLLLACGPVAIGWLLRPRLPRSPGFVGRRGVETPSIGDAAAAHTPNTDRPVFVSTQRDRAIDARGEIALVAILVFWGLVSQASYSLPHSCACFPGALAALFAWQRASHSRFDESVGVDGTTQPGSPAMTPSPSYFVGATASAPFEEAHDLRPAF